jgi:hypothetical protein
MVGRVLSRRDNLVVPLNVGLPGFPFARKWLIWQTMRGLGRVVATDYPPRMTAGSSGGLLQYLLYPRVAQGHRRFACLF